MEIPDFSFGFKEFIVACSSMFILVFQKFLSDNFNICILSVNVCWLSFPMSSDFLDFFFFHMLSNFGSYLECV